MAGTITVSVSNLPTECRRFGAHIIWVRVYNEMLKVKRELSDEDHCEDWTLRFDNIAAPCWCTKYIEEHDLAD